MSGRAPAAVCGLIAVFGLGFSGAPATADPIDIRLSPVSIARGELRRSPLRFVGGFRLFSEHPDFGGISAILLNGDNAEMVTDRGHFLRMSFTRAADGRIAGLAAAEIGPLLDGSGQPLTGTSADAEALARSPNGGLVWVAFERRHRIAGYPALGEASAAEAAQLPRGGFSRNGGIEALAVGRDGALIAIAEDPVDGPDGAGGDIAGWRLANGQAQKFRIERRNGFSATGAAVGPDGALYLLERFFSPLLGVQMRIRRFQSVSAERLAAVGGALGAGETLAHLRTFSGIDNMEAIAVEPRPGGGLLFTVVSDDNFNAAQKTLLLQFALDE